MDNRNYGHLKEAGKTFTDVREGPDYGMRAKLEELSILFDKNV